MTKPRYQCQQADNITKQMCVGPHTLGHNLGLAALALILVSHSMCNATTLQQHINPHNARKKMGQWDRQTDRHEKDA